MGVCNCRAAVLSGGGCHLESGWLSKGHSQRCDTLDEMDAPRERLENRHRRQMQHENILKKQNKNKLKQRASDSSKRDKWRIYLNRGLKKNELE